MIITNKIENQHVDKTKANVDKIQTVNKRYLLTPNTKVSNIQVLIEFCS